MTKYIILSLVLLLPNYSSNAQNLVPNPSLEEMVTCPESISEIYFPSELPTSLEGWSRPTTATSDYFHSCSPVAALANVPDNFAGNQLAKEGEAYAGAYCYMSGSPGFDYREYLQVQLITPLIAGHKYFVSYYTSLADEIGDLIALDQMGTYFSASSEERDDEVEILDDLLPQVTSPIGELLNDTANWMNISGTYTAAGEEEWMIVGNFTPIDDLSLEPVGPASDFSIGYYYFDDFCLLDMNTPTLTSSRDTGFCIGTEIVIQGKDGYSSYIWNDGTTTRQLPVTDTGSYWVSSIDLRTCTITVDTINVVASIETLDINLGNDTIICKNEPLELNVFNEAFKEYRWSTGQRSASILAPGAGTYYVTATSDCHWGTDTIVLSTPALPRVELPNDTILCNGSELSIGIAMGNLDYQWNTGQDACCITVTESGNYILTATNVCGESDADEIKIAYSGCGNCILAPTAFSPNGDGLNDRFEVFVNCLMKEYTLSVFNRWGQRVFCSFNVNDHWDGTVNGRPADLGVYFFYIEATPAIEGLGKINRKGDLTLIR